MLPKKTVFWVVVIVIVIGVVAYFQFPDLIRPVFQTVRRMFAGLTAP